ncbi:SMI1/KNR4 family protein [Kribbella sp. NPDC005582]|uniref:SMI1/KNR4 family protein n=1 Tax=Kribbella sp. NPDC005582 TaxID=3156893 RepID=UPI0033BB28BF
MSVATSWSRIVSWLEANDPATATRINPPATTVDLRYLQAAMNRPLPTELVEYLEIANGTEHRYIRGALVPPFYNLLPVMEMLSSRKMLRDIQRGIGEAGPLLGDSDPAGHPPHEWLDCFLPIALAYDGGLLYVDLRDGDQFGCVWEWHEWNVESAPYWRGVGEMLAEIAGAFVDGRPAPTRYHSPDLPQVTDGYLHWGELPV